MQFSDDELPVSDTTNGRDQEKILMHFSARDYDPTIARWTTKDPIGFNGGDTNLYAYVGGNPMSYVDPDGRFALPLLAVPVLTAGAGFIGSFTGTLIAHGTIKDAFSAGVGGAIAGGFAGVAAISGGGTILAAGVAAGVDVLYGMTTAIDSVPGPTPVRDVSTGLNSLINPNYGNRINDQKKCSEK